MTDKLQDVRDIFAKAGVSLDQDDTWVVQKTPVVKHKALERLACALKINFSVPDVLRKEADEAVLMVVGEAADGRSEWSIGEAKVVPMVDTGRKNQWGKPEYEAPEGIVGNYQVTPKQAAYPYAMAEKRAKDRVILKLARIEAYSEEEADEFKEKPSPAQTETPAPLNRAQEAYVKAANAVIDRAKTPEDLWQWWVKEADHRKDQKLSSVTVSELEANVKRKGAALRAQKKELEGVQS